jgi:membrane associated rhomboid family serine protease
VSGVPWLTVAVAVGAMAITGIPGASAAVALPSDAVASLWRWWAAHLGHFSASHVGWDLAVWVGLGAWLERRDARSMAWVTALSAPAVALGAVALAPIASYRGLSGIDAALVGAGVVALLQSARTPGERVLPLAMAAAFVAKVAYEAASAGTVFAPADGFVPVPAAHAIGAGVGAAVWACCHRT